MVVVTIAESNAMFIFFAVLFLKLLFYAFENFCKSFFHTHARLPTETLELCYIAAQRVRPLRFLSETRNNGLIPFELGKDSCNFFKGRIFSKADIDCTAVAHVRDRGAQCRNKVIDIDKIKALIAGTPHGERVFAPRRARGDGGDRIRELLIVTKSVEWPHAAYFETVFASTHNGEILSGELEPSIDGFGQTYPS